MNGGFELLGVVHLVRPTGFTAGNLEQLRAGIVQADSRTLFCHARQYQLRFPAESELPADDFSAWVNGVVQDRETAERISFAVQTRSGSADELRSALTDVLGLIPEAVRVSRDSPAEGEFVFLTVESVPLPTGVVSREVPDLVDALTEADASVWFYHLIEHPWFPEGQAIADWVEAQGERRVAGWLREDSASGLPIEAMRRKLLRRWRQSDIYRRISQAAGSPEDLRRAEGRAAMARLVRRIKPQEPAS